MDNSELPFLREAPWSRDRRAKTPDEDWHAYDAQGTLYCLDDYLRDALDRFEVERDAYWDRHADIGDADQAARKLAICVVSAAEHLVQGIVGSNPALQYFARGTEDKELRSWTAEYAALAVRQRRLVDNYVHEHVQQWMALAHCVGVEEMANRCLDLAQISVEVRPSVRTVKYLQRLSRVYILGLMPETVILCRAVLETAVIEAFAQRSMPLPQTPGGESTMSMRLKAAETLSMIDASTRRDAEAVWHRGNRAIHDDPELNADCPDTLRKTMKVLTALIR